MKYSEAMEIHQLLTSDVCEKVEESLIQLETGILCDSFISDKESVVTEAFEYVKETFKTLVTWFKNLFNKFVSIMRGFSFKMQESKLKRLDKKVTSSSEIELSDEEFESLQKALDEVGNVNVSISKKMKATALSNLCKAALKKGRETNDALRKGMNSMEISNNPREASTTMKSYTTMAKNCARVIKMTMSLMNKAIKNGMAESKEPVNPEAVSSKPENNSPRLLTA